MPHRRCEMSSSLVVTSATCRGRTSKPTSTSCSTSRTSATSGWPPRPSWGCRSTGTPTTCALALSDSRPRRASAGVGLAVHTHVNHANSVTPLVARASRGLLDAGIRDVRNQGVLMAGINDSSSGMLDLCFALLDGASILPYYFYMRDMIPFAEHWRVSSGRRPASAARRSWATCRALRHRAWSCDVPFVGKRWVHQVDEYDTVLGISYWSKNYRTGIELDDPDAVRKKHVYYDPVHALPEEGQQWWVDQGYAEGSHRA